MLASGSARYRDPNYEIRSWILFWSLPATTLLWVSLRFSLMLKILALSIRTHVFSDSSLRRKSTLPGLKVVAEPCLMCSDLILEWLLQPGKGNAPNDWTSVRWPLHPRLRRTVKSIRPAFVDTGEWVTCQMKIGVQWWPSIHFLFLWLPETEISWF